MDQNDKLLISLLNLHSSDVSSIHSACDDTTHLSVLLLLLERKYHALFVVLILAFLKVFILGIFQFLIVLLKTSLFS